MSSAAAVISPPVSTGAARIRHGALGVVAQYIQDLVHPRETA